jgi:hypothetical protein
MEDNNQPNVPPPEVHDPNEDLNEFMSFLRRENMSSNHAMSTNSDFDTVLGSSLRSVSSITPGLPSNHLYFHHTRQLDIQTISGLSRITGYYHNSATNMVLTNSLRDCGGVKNIISEEGKKELHEQIYKTDEFINSVCPITQESFVDGDKITVLPCKHCFYPSGITRWLENDKAECPVCRHKISSKEVRNEAEKENDDTDDEMPTAVDNDSELSEELDGDESDEDDEGDDDETYGQLNLPAPPDMQVIGNNINAFNPLLRQMIENIVRRNMERNITSSIEDASSNIIPNIDQNSIAHDEDTVDLQMALYASMIESHGAEIDADADAVAGASDVADADTDSEMED